MQNNTQPTCVSLEDWGTKCSEAPPGLSSLKTGFVLLLKLFFNSPSMLGPWEDALECVANGKLKIEPGTAVDPGNTENVPSIIVSTGEGLQLSKPWIGAPQGNLGGDYSTQINMHQCDVAVNFLVRHFNADIADQMADALMMLLIGSEQQIRNTWTWVVDYAPVNQTEAKRARQAQDPESFEEWYEARVAVKLTYIMSVAVRQESKRIAEIKTDAVSKHSPCPIDVA